MSGPRDKDEDGEVEYYTSADGRVCSSAADAIDASLQFESASDTGAGCSQSPDNVDDSEEPEEPEEPEDTYNDNDSDDPE